MILLQDIARRAFEEWDRTKQPLKQRGTILPLGEYEDGSVHPAWPGILAAPVEGLMNFGRYGYDSEEALRDNAAHAFDAAGGVVTGGLATTLVGRGVPANALSGAGGKAPLAVQAAEGSASNPIPGVTFSSNRGNLFDYPELPKRPFHEDYPDAHGPLGEPLTHTMDGVPLRSQFVAGRQTWGGGDMGLGPGDISDLSALIANAARPALAGEIGTDAGRYLRVAGPDGPQTSILYRSDLDDAARPRILAHEIGHAVDDKAGSVPLEGLVRKLQGNYNTGTNANRGRVPGKDLGDAAAWAKPERPQDHGYTKPDDINAELMAEGVRAYLTNPNYLKTRYPELAARIREYVNENPRLSPHIQLNANAPSAASVPLMTADDEYDDPLLASILQRYGVY
jgi:hypothetical protein